ncbi:MAG: diguanylate cyclase [Pedobacter sp.]|nr:diguanylate cyclase [Pedobacter sp.]
MTHPETHLPARTEEAVMREELARLSNPLALLSGFPPALEQAFELWLDARLRNLLRQYLWALVLLYAVLVAVSLIRVGYFTAEPWRSADMHMSLFKELVLAVTLGMLSLFMRTDIDVRRSRQLMVLVSVLLLVTLAIGMQAYQDPSNHLMGVINLWICATVIFATGLQLPRVCVVIAVLSIVLTILLCLVLGLQQGLAVFSLELFIVGVFLLSFACVMTGVHRQVFLQAGLLQKDKERLTELSEQLAELSLKDSLTGVANRRRFDELLEREWARLERHGSSLALLFIDADNFKAYNDHYGHQAGDDCLRALAFVLVDAGRRQGDLVARYGGEEFVLLLPDTDMAGALDAANRIRSFLAQAALPHAVVPSGRVTASIGVAVSHPGIRTAAELVAAADRALYRAKQSGRDRIEVEAVSA